MSTGTYCTSSASVPARIIAYRATTSTFDITISGVPTPTSSVYLDLGNSTILNYPSIIADPVGIFWKASDLSKFEPSYAAALASKFNIGSATTAAPTAFPTQAAAPSISSGIPGSTSPPSSSPNLSTGAKAGIGVGTAFGALTIAAAIFLLLRWRKRRPSHTNPPSTYNPAAAEAPELVQYHNPVRQSDAMSGMTYTEHIPKSPTSPMSPRQ